MSDQDFMNMLMDGLEPLREAAAKMRASGNYLVAVTIEVPKSLVKAFDGSVFHTPVGQVRVTAVERQPIRLLSLEDDE
jgi:hypothetical protein